MLWLPAIVFLAIAVWLVRRLMIAARNEDVLREQRLADALGQQPLPPRPQLAPAPPPPERPLDTADVTQADPSHLPLVEQMVVERELQLKAQHAGRRVEVLWVRSNATHAVWCERRHAAAAAAQALTRDVICVAQIQNGKIGERWFFG